MKMRTKRQNIRGFTLVEIMIASMVSTVILGAMIYAAVQFQQLFTAADSYSAGTADEMRAMDLITRDIRSSLTTPVWTGTSVSVTLPDAYTSYDAQGNPTGSLRTPTTSTSGSLVYGDSTKPLQVTYSVTNGAIVRTQTVMATGTTSQVVVANSVVTSGTGFFLSNPALTSTINVGVMFAPRYLSSSNASSNQINGTLVTANVALRNQ